MPAKSQKQARLMGMVAHDKGAANRLGIPQSVGKEFEVKGKGGCEGPPEEIPQEMSRWGRTGHFDGGKPPGRVRPRQIVDPSRVAA